MPELKTREHQWVKMVITPIDVLSDGEGNPIPFVDPDKQNQAEENASYGCYACTQPLEGNYGTECQQEVDSIARL